MSPDKYIVITAGAAAIIFTYWFFLMKRESVAVAGDSIDIRVSGGYNPSVIEVQKGKKTTLNFVRTDPSQCLEEVVLSDLKIKRFLPLNQPVKIEIAPEKTGEMQFSCGMGMFHGKIIVT